MLARERHDEFDRVKASPRILLQPEIPQPREDVVDPIRVDQAAPLEGSKRAGDLDGEMRRTNALSRSAWDRAA